MQVFLFFTGQEILEAVFIDPFHRLFRTEIFFKHRLLFGRLEKKMLLRFPDLYKRTTTTMNEKFAKKKKKKY